METFRKNTLTIVILTLFLAASSNSEVYRSYQNAVYCNSSSPIQYPKNALELQNIIQQAIDSKTTVKVLGGSYSITDVICTEGIPINPENINYAYFTDDTKEFAVVGTGAQAHAVMDFLEDAGRSLIHIPTYGGITMGGAIGTGAHGSSLLHFPSLSDQMVAMTIIDGTGQFRNITSTEELKAFRVHLGLLGAVVDVTFKTVPKFKMTVENRLESDSILFDGTVLADARTHDWYQLWWFPSSNETVVSKGKYYDDTIPGEAVVNLIPDVGEEMIGNVRDTYEASQATNDLPSQYTMEQFSKITFYMNVPGRQPFFAETINGTTRFVNPATGWVMRLQNNLCTSKCGWDNEDQSILPEESAMAFDMQELPRVISKMKDILAELPAAFMMVGVLIRFSKASDGLMSLASGRDTVHIEWTTPMRFNPYNDPKGSIGTYQAILQAMVHDHDGRPHWGKNGQYFHNREIIQKTRPAETLQAFQEAMKKYDPNGIFMNKFGRRLLGESDELSWDPSVTKCALQDYCMCAKDDDCGAGQACGKYGEFPVCKERNDRRN